MKGILFVLLMVSTSVFACPGVPDQCRIITQKLTQCEDDENVVNVKECFQYVREMYKEWDSVCF